VTAHTAAGPGPGVLGARAAGDPADWSDRVSLTFAIGVYVAVNAIRDAYLLVDAPDCAHFKTQYVQGNHDWFSTLVSASGRHRIANTDLHPWKIAGARDAAIEAFLKRIADHPATGAALVTSLPMATITGLDYDRLVRSVGRATGKLVANVPGDGLNGDWLDGYAATLAALARNVPLDGAAPVPGAIGVVGYLMDRNEGDHRGNLAEMERLLGALGLRLASTWLSGGASADLARIREASAIVSLPYGREAARTLAERLRVPLVEADLPLGLAATERWLRQVAEALGASQRLPAVLDAELGRAVPRVQWVLPYHLLHRRLLFIGDPHLGLAISEMASEIGTRVVQLVILNRKRHAQALLERLPAVPTIFDPKRDTLAELVRSLAGDARCDLLVTSSIGLTPGASPVGTVELGFPSFYTHALEDRPFLFARGFTVLVERMMNELRRAELTASGTPPV
jgi:nitrogenase molybdenum-iron protein alpha/beta subunit